MDTKALTRNTRIIAEALTRVIYNLTEKVRAAHPALLASLSCSPELAPGSSLSFPLQGAPADLQIFTDQMVSTACFCNQRRGRDWEPGRVLISVCAADSVSLVVFSHSRSRRSS